MAACLSGHTEMAALLISRGAELDSDPDESMSPLFCAAEGGHVRTTQLLLSRGADPHRALKVRDVIVGEGYPPIMLQKGGSLGGFVGNLTAYLSVWYLVTLNDQYKPESQVQ